MRLRVFCLTILLTTFLVCDASTAAQVQPTTLVLGTRVERTLGAKQVHRFQLNMEQDQYAQLVVDQHGIDLVVRVLSPKGKVLGEFDSPNGTEGAENVVFVASSPGPYTIAVMPLERSEDVKPGQYEISLLELRQATEEELGASRNEARIRAKAMDLISAVVQTIPQIRLIPTRINAQLQMADLLWDADQKVARQLGNDAMAAINEYLANLDLDDPNFYQNYSSGMYLRNQVIQSIAPHDPEMALNFLRSSRTVTNTLDKNQQQLQESQLELSLAMQVLKNDPKQAFQIAESTLKTHPSPELIQTLMRLNTSSPELAKKLAAEIVAKIEDSKLINDPALAQLTANLIRVGQSPRNSVTTPNSRSAGSMLSQEDYRTLVQKAISEVVAYNPSATDMSTRNSAQNLIYALRSMSAAVETAVPGSSAAIEKKLSQYNAVADRGGLAWQKYQNTITNSTAEAALEAIPKAPPEIREQLYANLSQLEAARGNAVRARQLIMDQITDPMQRHRLLMNLDQQAITQAAAQGRIDEALRAIAALPSDRRRCEVLAQIAGRIGVGQKRAAAISMLETARGLIGSSSKADNQAQLFALLQVARAFARYDSARAFEILDPLVDQLNEITEAARTMSGFGQEFFQNDELNLQNGNNVASIANQLIDTLAQIGKFDFDHAKNDADRIQRLEIRSIAYIAIARVVIKESI
jgi:hypothetical protein